MLSYKNYSKIIFILLAVFGALPSLIQTGTLAYVIQLIILFLISCITYYFRNSLFPESFFYKKGILYFYSIYSFFILFHSFFIAESYEQWRYLITVFMPMLFLPVVSVIASKEESISQIFRVLLKVCLPLSFLILFYGKSASLENVSFVYYSGFIYLLILFIPFLSTKWKIIVIIASLISFGYNLSNRSNLLNIIVSYSLVLIYYLLPFKKYLFNRARLFFFILPIIGFFLILVMNVNIWTVIQSYNKITLQIEDGNLSFTQDSRTGIYNDAFNHLNSNKWGWLIGVSAVDIHETMLADYIDGYFNGRLGGSESGFLSFLLFGGIPYVILFLLLSYKSSSNAALRSNSIFLKMLAAFLAFRWMFTFIETPMGLQFSWIINFLLIGFCMNPALLRFTDNDIQTFFISHKM